MAVVALLRRGHRVCLRGLTDNRKESDLCRGRRGSDGEAHAGMLEYLDEWSDIGENRDL